MSSVELIACDRCDTVDFVEVGSYSRGNALCFRCREGIWHGMFQEQGYNEAVHTVANREKLNDEGLSFS